ncbi:hypothetical protein [Kaarinaea lacus]
MMYTRRYFITTLALPLIIVGIGVLVVGVITDVRFSNISTLLTPYLCFFGVLSIWALNNAPNKIRKAAYRAPLIYLAFELSYLIVEYAAGASLAKDIVGLGGVLIIVATYIVIVGYLYTFIMEQGYFSYLDQKRRASSLRPRLHC